MNEEPVLDLNVMLLRAIEKHAVPIQARIDELTLCNQMTLSPSCR